MFELNDFGASGMSASRSAGPKIDTMAAFKGKTGMWLFSNRGNYAIIDFDDADAKGYFHWYFLIRSTDGSEEFKLGQNSYRDSRYMLAWQAEEQM